MHRIELRKRPAIPRKMAWEKLRRHDARLLLTYTTTGPIYCLMNGDRLTPEDAAAIIANPEIEECDDGLFPGRTQTWRIRHTT
jgi:hypothetical protein